jgi:DNA invertase Pin-like site-specific DNA recombinase
MPKKYFKAEEIINILRQVEILMSQGQTAQMAARGVGISEQTYYRWPTSAKSIVVCERIRLSGSKS